MIIIQTPENRAGPRVCALGVFDGVHLGHRKLLETGIKIARQQGILLRACTFDPHPLTVIAPERAPKMLTTLQEKAALMAALGVDELQVIPFSRQVAEMAPAAFLSQLRQWMDLRVVVVGWNYTFGWRGQGTPETLAEDGRLHGYKVTVIPPVTTDQGQVISSSSVRSCLRSDDRAGAEALLGHAISASDGMDG